MNIKPPCYGCSDRAMGCHGKCEFYIEYQEKLVALNTKRAEVKKQERVFSDCLSSISKLRMYKGW